MRKTKEEKKEKVEQNRCKEYNRQSSKKRDREDENSISCERERDEDKKKK